VLTLNFNALSRVLPGTRLRQQELAGARLGSALATDTFNQRFSR